MTRLVGRVLDVPSEFVGNLEVIHKVLGGQVRRREVVVALLYEYPHGRVLPHGIGEIDRRIRER